jgi:chromosomal replication initiator protein
MGGPLVALVSEIQRATAARFKIQHQDLVGRRNLREYARPRQIAMSLACELTRHSVSRIGHFFDRDHSTVLHARRQVARLERGDLDVMAALSELRERLAPVPQQQEEQADG